MHGADHSSADDENTPSWDLGILGASVGSGILGGFVPRLLVWTSIKWLRVSFRHYGLCRYGSVGVGAEEIGDVGEQGRGIVSWQMERHSGQELLSERREAVRSC
jgi:hypothetical protein